jgi:MOSC domain-containing protein YiiM
VSALARPPAGGAPFRGENPAPRQEEGPAGECVRLLGVQVGAVAPLAAPDGDRRPAVPSGIVKRPVAGPVAISALGLAGDEQADPTVHGGLEKAVYAHPSEHYAFWRACTGRADLHWGALGENLTLAGLLETGVWIGDALHIGSAVLLVADPRRPCEKLARHLGVPTVGREMVLRGISGWYLRVLAPGFVRAGDPVRLVPGPRTLSLAERQRQMFRPADLR